MAWSIFLTKDICCVEVLSIIADIVVQGFIIAVLQQALNFYWVQNLILYHKFKIGIIAVTNMPANKIRS